MHGNKYLSDVIQSLEEAMENKKQWKKLSVWHSLDGFAKDKFKLNLKNYPDVKTFATLTELPLWLLTVSIGVEQLYNNVV